MRPRREEPAPTAPSEHDDRNATATAPVPLAARDVSLRDQALDDVLDDLTFTQAALGADPEARDLLPEIAPHLAGWEAARRALREAQRAETAAAAVAAVRDAELDDLVLELARALLEAVHGDANDPRFRRYFSRAPRELTRAGRLVEATTVNAWVPWVRLEPEPAIAALADRLATGSAASLAASDAADAAAAQHLAARLRVDDTFIAAAAAALEAVHAELVRRGVERGKPQGWADRFFRALRHRWGAPR